MKNSLILSFFIFSMTLHVGILQEIKRDKICYDKDSIDPLELKCKYSTIFYISNSTTPLLPVTFDKNKYDLIIDQPNNLKTLKIIKTDKQDNGYKAYRADDTDNGDGVCEYDMLRHDSKTKHKGEFKFDNLTPIQLSDGFTQSAADIPTIKVTDPNDFSIPIYYSFEALPLKSITITVNNETRTSEKICEKKLDDEIDCIDFNETLKIKNECPNNKIELSLSYILNDWLNCSLKTVGPFKYEFMIQYPPTNIGLSSNLSKSDNTEFDYKAKLKDVAEFSESVLCANPTKIKYNRKIITKYSDDDNQTTVILPESENNKFEIIFDEEFETKVIESCMSNGIGDAKCVNVSVEYYKEPTTYEDTTTTYESTMIDETTISTPTPSITPSISPSITTPTIPSTPTTPKNETTGGGGSGPSPGEIAGIVVGSIGGLVVIIAVCVLIVLKCKKSSTPQQPTQQPQPRTSQNTNQNTTSFINNETRRKQDIVTDNDLYTPNTDYAPTVVYQPRPNPRQNTGFSNDAVDFEELYSKTSRQKPNGRLEPLDKASSSRPLPPDPLRRYRNDQPFYISEEL